MAKATTASATAAEKDAEKVQAVENTTTEEKAVKTGKYAVGNSKADLHWTEPAKSNAAMQQDF